MFKNKTNAIAPKEYNMEQGCTTKAGSQKTQDPCLVGSILHEFVNNSNSPLAKNYRKFLAANKSNAEKGDNKHE